MPYSESVDANLFLAAGKPDNWSSLSDRDKSLAARDGLLKAGSPLKVRDIRAGAEFKPEPEPVVEAIVVKTNYPSPPKGKKKATKKRKK